MVDESLSVVVIEDDTEIAALIARSFGRAGLTTAFAGTAAEGLDLVRSNEPHVVLLDLGLPDRDGLDVLKEIRQSGNGTGVICVTARVDELDRILGFESGADDYVTKPFSPRELVGRVKALGRRVSAVQGPSAGAKAEATVVDAGRVQLDMGRRDVQVDGEGIDFTRMEFDLLAYLLDRRGAACRRAEIVEQVWGHSWVGNSRTLDVHVGQLRRKVGDALTITTLRGVGYRLET